MTIYSNFKLFKAWLLKIRATLNRGVFDGAVLNKGAFRRAVNFIDLEHSALLV